MFSQSFPIKLKVVKNTLPISDVLCVWIRVCLNPPANRPNPLYSTPSLSFCIFSLVPSVSILIICCLNDILAAQQVTVKVGNGWCKDEDMALSPAKTRLCETFLVFMITLRFFYYHLECTFTFLVLMRSNLIYKAVLISTLSF